jgi:Domain of unknown function DUF29
MDDPYDTDFLAWTQAQAAALRAHDWQALDIEHLADEIESLTHTDCHNLHFLMLGFMELIYHTSPDEQGNYYWQSAVIDYHRGMLELSLEDSPRMLAVLEQELPRAYAWARKKVMGRRTPPTQEPPQLCPWTLAQMLDDPWWPPEAPERLP